MNFSYKSLTQHLFFVYYVYYLQHRKNGVVYYGYTNDLQRRLKEHQREDAGWSLVYYEAYRAEGDARQREQRLKDYGQARTHLRRRLQKSLSEK